MTLLSVVTPTYNQARYLPEALRSVAALPLDHQHIVVDGQSSDGTRAILESRDDASLEWLSEPDNGQTDAVNKGLARATGVLVGWLNSDDAYVPDAVGRAVAYMQGHPEVDAVFGFMEIVDADGKLISTYRCGEFNWRRYLFLGSYIPTPTIIFRRRLLDDVGLLDVAYRDAADFDFYLRLLRGATVHLLREPLVQFRLHPDSKTVRDVDVQRREAMAISRRWARNRRDLWLMRWADRVRDLRVSSSDEERIAHVVVRKLGNRECHGLAESHALEQEPQ